MGLFDTDEWKQKGKDEMTNMEDKAKDEMDKLKHRDNQTGDTIQTHQAPTDQTTDEQY